MIFKRPKKFADTTERQKMLRADAIAARAVVRVEELREVLVDLREALKVESNEGVGGA